MILPTRTYDIRGGKYVCTHAELAASFRFLLHRKDKFWFDNVGASKQLKMHHLSIVSWIANTPKIVDIYSTT